VAAPPISTIKPYRGALGIDINPDHLDVGIINKVGNKIWQQKFPLKLNGNTKQNETEIGITVAKIIDIAQWLQIPVASEKLNFDMKTKELRYLPGKQAKKLSSFAYNSIMQHIQGRCIESGVEHKMVNPAWTSFLAQINYAAQYGISVDQGAACVIARRALGFRERVNSRASKVGPERSTFEPNRRGRNLYYRALAKKVLPLKRANTYGLEFLNRGSPKTLSSSTELSSSVESNNLLGGRRSSPNRRLNRCGVNTILLVLS
jgi:IS605 OrfB family transposase